MQPRTEQRLRISPVAFHSYVNITHPDMVASPDSGMGSLIFRIPEFVRCGEKRRPAGFTSWEIVRPETELRYRWAPPEELRREFATEFRGSVVVEGEEMKFDVADRNVGPAPAPGGVSLFCLQAGPAKEFHDLEGRNTFVWVQDRFISIHELAGGRFPEHRMVGAKYAPGDASGKSATRKLMVKRSEQTGFVVAVALDRCSGLAGNFNIWPSCIHANPDWGVLQPGEEAVVRGKVYFFRGALDDVLERYVRDFES